MLSSPVFCVAILALTACLCISGSSYSTQRPSSQAPGHGNKWHPLAIGVGFDLSMSYAAVAASFENGTTLEIDRLAGDEEYKKVMRHYARTESMHPHPPYNDAGDAIRDRSRQWRRNARKAVSLPPSTESEILSAMVSALKEKAEIVLGQPVTVASIALPHMPAFYGEDVADIFNYLGIQERPFMDSDGDDRVVWHQSALWAGHGIGLCPDYINQTACWQDQHGFPERASIAFGYEDDLLVVAKASMWHVYKVWNRAHIDDELGWNQRCEPGYTEAMQQKILTTMEAYKWPGEENRTLVIPYGQHGSQPEFVKMLEAALVSQSYSGFSKVIKGKPRTVVALGAAEIAKRGPAILDDPSRPRSSGGAADTTPTTDTVPLTYQYPEGR